MKKTNSTINSKRKKMLLSSYIESLQKFMEENGDLECFYATDDEGNAYQRVSWTGSLMYLPKYAENEWRPDLFCQEDVDNNEHGDEDDKVTPVVVIN